MPCHIGQRHAMLCQVVLCHAMLAHVRLCRALSCRAVSCHAAGLTLLLSPRRQLRRCPGSHCLTLPNVPIDVFIAMGGSGRPRTA